MIEQAAADTAIRQEGAFVCIVWMYNDLEASAVI